MQGGPLMHIVAAKAVALGEALREDFAAYQRAIVHNASKLAEVLAARGLRIVSGGTDNHVFLVDVTAAGTTGKGAEDLLEQVGITVNKNTIPYDPNPPLIASGIRLGTPAVTSRGMGGIEMEQIGHWIAEVLHAPDDTEIHTRISSEVRELCSRFPLYAVEQADD